MLPGPSRQLPRSEAIGRQQGQRGAHRVRGPTRLELRPLALQAECQPAPAQVGIAVLLPTGNVLDPVSIELGGDSGGAHADSAQIEAAHTVGRSLLRGSGFHYCGLRSNCRAHDRNGHCLFCCASLLRQGSGGLLDPSCGALHPSHRQLLDRRNGLLSTGGHRRSGQALLKYRRHRSRPWPRYGRWPHSR